MMKRTLAALAVALSGCNDDHGAQSPQSGTELIKLIERGDGGACNNQVVRDHINLLATGRLTYSEEYTWNGGWTPALVQDFRSSFVTGLTDIVRNGYDESASRITCGALYTAETNGAWFSSPIEYDIQLTVDREPLIALRDERQLQETAWRAHHLYYCENIYPEQVQSEGTPYGMVCTLDELRRVDRSRLERLVRPNNAPQTEYPQSSIQRADATAEQEPAEQLRVVEREVDQRTDRVEYTGPPVIDPGPPTPARPPAPTRQTTISNPMFERRVAAEFPGRARAMNVLSGVVSLDCRVSANGSLTDCKVLSEDPPGADFAQAALAGVRSARVAPRTVNAVVPGGRTTFTVRFNPPD